MTAPGDSVLIFILLALLVASAAYAGGRLHQRRQFREDREEAYLDGYETASDRVFSLAVRAMNPKRVPRGRAVVRPAQPAAPDPAAPSSPAETPGAPRPEDVSLAATAGHTGDTAALPRSQPILPSVPKGRPHPADVAGPSTETGLGISQPAPAPATTPRGADPGRAVRHQGVPAAKASAPSREKSRPLAAAGIRPGHAAASISSTVPASPKPLLRRRADQRRSEASRPLCGFPVPPPPPRNAIAEPTAVGGVTYQPFPDPRPADGSGPALGRRSPEATSTVGSQTAPASNQRSRFGSAFPSSTPAQYSPAVGDSHPEGAPGSPSSTPGSVAGPPPAPPGTTVGPAPQQSSSGGKHTVPDELVQAPTYRLPPDRIFRARVPTSTPLPDEPTTPLAVPKPRRRSNENVAPPP